MIASHRFRALVSSDRSTAHSKVAALKPCLECQTNTSFGTSITAKPDLGRFSEATLVTTTRVNGNTVPELKLQVKCRAFVLITKSMASVEPKKPTESRRSGSGGRLLRCGSGRLKEYCVWCHIYDSIRTFIQRESDVEGLQ